MDTQDTLVITELVSKVEAKRLGLSTYFTGKACVHNHVSQRYTSSGHCVECAKLRANKWYRDNRSDVLEYMVAYSKKNPDVNRRASEKYRKNNPDKRQKTQKEYYMKNTDLYRRLRTEWRSKNRDKDRQHSRTYYNKHRNEVLKKASEWGVNNKQLVSRKNKEYRCQNRAYFRAYARLRNNRETQACPHWVDKREVAKIYRVAAEAGLSVDHVIPLRGKTVCGLHVPWNLRAVPRAFNSWKHNKLLTDAEYESALAAYNTEGDYSDGCV